MRRLAVWAIILFGFLFVGCGDKQEADITLRYLERGNFVGDINIQSDGSLGAGYSAGFWAGANKTMIAAKGRVDFSGHEGDETVVGEPLVIEDESDEPE